MSTGEFFYVLLWSCFAEAIVLGVCIPIILAVRNHTKPTRELRRQQREIDQFAVEASAAFSDLYANIKGGTIIVPPDYEDRVLELCAQARDLNVGSERKKELW